jgi:acetyl-CoA carboxylase biotin carboxyl carrier protein
LTNSQEQRGAYGEIEVESEVSGNVWKIEKAVGDQVNEEDVIMILESMKMEIPVEAPTTGTLVELLVKADQAVDEDQVVAIIEAD